MRLGPFELGKLRLDPAPCGRIGLVGLRRREQLKRFLLSFNCLRDFSALEICLRQNVQMVAARAR